jgi:hypothetical protein
MSENKKHTLDKIQDDNSKIVVTTKTVKWLFGILGTSIVSLLSFAWGLYVTVDGKVDTKFQEVNVKMNENQKELIQKIDDLDRNKVKENTKHNHTQDLNIVRLFERVDSRNQQINRTTTRPEVTDTTNRPDF